jgi:hypothetical protein
LRIYKATEKTGILKDVDVKLCVMEPNDASPKIPNGITKEQFHSILDKASQPINNDNETKIG